VEGWAGWMAATHAFRLSGSARGTSVRAQLSGPVKKGFLLELQKILGSRKPYKRFSLGERITLEGVNSVILLSSVESPPPRSPRLPGDWDPGARQEPRTIVRRPAPVGATPVADQPIEPLRGQL